MLGYDPAVGKRLLDTRKLLDEDRDAIRVALTFDNGFGVRRALGDSMDVAVQPDRGERTIVQAETRIRDETGAFVYALDLGPFLALSSEKRKEALFALLPRELGEVEPDVFRRWLGYDEADSPIQRAIDRMWTDHLPQVRTEITKRVWSYIKQHNLQDTKIRRMINTDEKLRPVLGGKAQVSMFEMTKLINAHLTEVEAVTA